MKNLTIEELKEIVEAINNNRVDIDMIAKQYVYSYGLKEFRLQITVYFKNFNYGFDWCLLTYSTNLSDFKTALDIYIDKIFIELKQLPK